MKWYIFNHPVTTSKTSTPIAENDLARLRILRRGGWQVLRTYDDADPEVEPIEAIEPEPIEEKPVEAETKTPVKRARSRSKASKNEKVS